MVIKLSRFAALVSTIFIMGCAAIQPPNPEEVLKHPLGTNALRLGMPKDEVESVWGKPDEVNFVEDKDIGKGGREEWVYYAKYSALMPVDAGYASKTKRLYFDGDNLTHIKE